MCGMGDSLHPAENSIRGGIMHGQISREIFWNMETPGAFPTAQVLLYILALGAILFLIRGLLKSGFFTRVKVMMKATGSETDRLDNPGERFWHTIIDVFGHKKLLREPYQGTLHFLILWGFIILFLGAMLDFFQVDIIEPIWVSTSWRATSTSAIRSSPTSPASWCSSAFSWPWPEDISSNRHGSTRKLKTW